MKLLFNKEKNQVFQLKQVMLFPLLQVQLSLLTLNLFGRLSQKLMLDGPLMKLEED